MEVIKLESLGHYQEDMMMPADIFLLQVRPNFHLCQHVKNK